MLELQPGYLGDEPTMYQALQLGMNVLMRFLGQPGVTQLAQGGGVLGQHLSGQPCHLLCHQAQARAPLFHQPCKRARVEGQCIPQKSTVQGQLDDLLLEVGFGSQGHVSHRHALQVGNVLLQELQRLSNLQGNQAP